MQYVWQHRLWPTSGLTTTDGRKLHVLDPGQINTAAGPDFFNAKIELDGERWVGNVEIHYRASDWMRHGHQNDPAYDSVILHVVEKDDMPIIRRGSTVAIPQTKMPNAEQIYRHYLAMKGAPPADITCRDTIASTPRLYMLDWVQALGYERLYQKSERIAGLAQHLGGDWEEAAYVTIARAMGLGSNNDAFEQLARLTPLKCLRKHGDDICAIEAMLFGQASLLESVGDTPDPYLERLKGEYAFLAHKYSLHGVDRRAWKLGRMRPWNFPHRRIAILAALVQRIPHLMSAMSTVRGEKDARELFDFELNGYWRTHHRFGSDSTEMPRAMSVASCRLLIINAIVPMVHAWANVSGDHRTAQEIAEVLQKLPPESNHIVASFVDAGIPCPDAFTSQALIQLRREYCEQRKCIYCRFGYRHLSVAANARRHDPDLQG